MKERRKRLIVNKLQYRFVFYTLFIVIAVSLILIITTLLLFNREIFGAGRCNFVQFAILIVIALILYSITLRIMVKYSNRIYGPLYRLGNYLQDLSEGKETGQLKFRKEDVIDGLSEIYNGFYKSLRKTLRYDYNEMVKTFSELENILDKLHNKTISNNELYDSLQNICTRLARALDITSETVRDK
uniref:Methyl-accepting chemotaxis protein n=1 Tax=candidate division WOR-3 bacterium TaxID=2052148 RepID=A0A7C4XF62_UNCW3